MYVMYGNEQFRDETCHLIYLELALNFQILFQSPCSTCGAWKSLRSQTNHAPSVYAVPLKSLLLSNEKSYILLMMGLESQRCYRVLNQETALSKNSIMG